MKILIVFYSTYGHVYKMAQAVAEGAKTIEGAEVEIRRVPETLPQVLNPYSLEVLNDVGAEDYQQTFLQGLHRKLSVWAIERVACARIRR